MCIAVTVYNAYHFFYFCEYLFICILLNSCSVCLLLVLDLALYEHLKLRFRRRYIYYYGISGNASRPSDTLVLELNPLTYISSFRLIRVHMCAVFDFFFKCLIIWALQLTDFPVLCLCQSFINPMPGSSSRAISSWARQLAGRLLLRKGWEWDYLPSGRWKVISHKESGSRDQPSDEETTD